MTSCARQLYGDEPLGSKQLGLGSKKHLVEEQGVHIGGHHENAVTPFNCVSFQLCLNSTLMLSSNSIHSRKVEPPSLNFHLSRDPPTTHGMILFRHFRPTSYRILFLPNWYSLTYRILHFLGYIPSSPSLWEHASALKIFRAVDWRATLRSLACNSL